MKHVLPKMPQESAELPQFLETVKKLYAMYEVPAEVQAKILIPLITAQAKSLVNQMTIDDMSKHDELKEFLLTEYKLTPKEYKIQFKTAVKNAAETYTLFAARLLNLLFYYLKSRIVENYDTLIGLLISDRLKGSLPQRLLNYILTQKREGWYVANKVALLANVYVNNCATVISQKTPEGKSEKVATAATSGGATASQNSRGGRGGHYQAGRGGFGGHQSPTQTQKVRCYGCGELEHITRDCPQERADDHDGLLSPLRLDRIRCHNCTGWGHMARDCASEPSGSRGGFKEGWRGMYRGNSQGDEPNRGVRVNLVLTNETTQVKTRERGVQYEDGGEQANPGSRNSWEFGDHPIVGTACAYDASSVNVRTFPLKHVNVTVSGCNYVALENSGCQIPLVSNRLFLWCCDETVGNVILHGFGRDQTVRAPLANLTVCLSDVDCDGGRELPIMCAVTDLYSPEYDVILPAAVVRNLQAKAVVSNGLCNGPTVRACRKGQPRVNLTTADRLFSGIKIRTTIGLKPRSSDTDRQPKRNVGCGMSDWAYAVTMLCILCVALIVCIALCYVIDNRDIMFVRVLTPAFVVLSCILPSQRIEEGKFAHLQP